MPRQNSALPVFSFAARARDVVRFARIERAGRDSEGTLKGFQRPQIAGHINEIRDYLEKPSAILPNPIVIGFTGSASIEAGIPAADGRARTGWLTIDVSAGAPGWIVDGQQRFTALRDIGEADGRDFEVLVSGFICENVAELQKQFILINNTRPLPKALVCELLPQVEDLPRRMSNRSQAALLTEALNYKSGSSLKGLIRQQTNPRGVIRDTVLQRVIMTSISDGALRLYASENALLLDKGYALISEFFHAVQHVFRSDWGPDAEDLAPHPRRRDHRDGLRHGVPSLGDGVRRAGGLRGRSAPARREHGLDVGGMGLRGREAALELPAERAQRHQASGPPPRAGAQARAERAKRGRLSMAYSVKEIFYTLQGEGRNAGRAAVFCRFAGCNLWSGREADRNGATCRFCDTDFVGTDGPGGGRFASAGDLSAAIASAWGGGEASERLVVLTGGEPLLQADSPLVEALHGERFEVAVETNGTIAAPRGLDWICVSPKAGAPIVQTFGDELKLVFPQHGAEPASFEGSDFSHFLLQPMDGPNRRENTAKAIAYCMAHPKWRFSFQTHKAIGIR